jgi:response regulator RpfG family c-di-GMP phosphodiesterase
MPKKDGRTVYNEIKEIDPAMKALFISGYTADIIHRKGIYEDNINFLSKPVLPYDLAIKVREILDS